MPSHADYQPLSQSADDDFDELGGNVAGPSVQTPSRRPKGLKRASRPGPIDLKKLDVAFKRCAQHSHNILMIEMRANTVVKMDRKHCTEGKGQEEGRVRRFSQGDSTECF